MYGAFRPANQLKRSCPRHFCRNLINGCSRGDVKTPEAFPPATIAGAFRRIDRTEMLSAGVVDVDSVARGHPYIPHLVGFQTIDADAGEVTSIAQTSIILDVVNFHYIRLYIGDVESLLVRRERNAIRGRRFGHNSHLALWRRAAHSAALPSDLIHARFRKIREINAAVDGVYQVVWRLQPFFGEDCDGCRSFPSG